MTRPLSYLSNESLDNLLSMALAIARRCGGRYDHLECWAGKRPPNAVFHLLDEYLWRNRR